MAAYRSIVPARCEIFVGPHKFVVVRRFDFDKDRNVLSVHIAHKEVVRSSYIWFVHAAASVLNRVDRGALSEPGDEGLELVVRVHASVDAPNAFSEQIEVDGGKVFAKVVDIVKGGERQPLQLRGCVSGRCVAWVPCWHADLTSFRCAVMAEFADVVDDLKSLATFRYGLISIYSNARHGQFGDAAGQLDPIHDVNLAMLIFYCHERVRF
jgi:hypothetical protein